MIICLRDPWIEWLLLYFSWKIINLKTQNDHFQDIYRPFVFTFTVLSHCLTRFFSVDSVNSCVLFFSILNSTVFVFQKTDPPSRVNSSYRAKADTISVLSYFILVQSAEQIFAFPAHFLKNFLKIISLK